MKMSQMKWWTLLLLITIGLVSPACSSKNDPDDDEEETEELTGVITVNMRNESQGNTSIEILTKSGVTAGYLRISNENNFETILLFSLIKTLPAISSGLSINVEYIGPPYTSVFNNLYFSLSNSKLGFNLKVGESK